MEPPQRPAGARPSPNEITTKEKAMDDDATMCGNTSATRPRKKEEKEKGDPTSSYISRQQHKQEQLSSANTRIRKGKKRIPPMLVAATHHY